MSISVVIPYYNNSEDVERCLKSIVSQTMIANEVHVIDDCSNDSDALIDILAKYDKLLNIKYTRNEVNKNAAYSRNYGMKNSISQFIALLDADDYWSKEHLEQSFYSINKLEADFVYSNIYVSKNNIITKSKVSDIDKLDNPSDIILLSPPQTGSFFFKKTLIDIVSFDESLRRHQDYQFLLDVVLSGKKLIYIDRYTSYYCVSRQLLLKKLDFPSIFSFWNKYRINFSKKPLQEYLIRMLCLNLKTDNDYNIAYFISEYEVLSIVKRTSFYSIYKLIGDGNKFSRMILFIYFKIRYDLIKKIK